jgi:hypothetical protein
MAFPPALPPASGNVRDVPTDAELESILPARSVESSLITVPPAVGSVPPPDIPPAPVVPSISYVAQDETAPLAPMTPALGAAVPASRDRAAGPATWAVFISMAAIALPGSLVLGEALISHPVTARSAQPAAAAPSFAPETNAAPATAVDSTGPSPPSEVSPAPSMSNLNTAGDPVDPRPMVRTPRPTHHGKGKSAPKPAESAASAAASSSDPSAQ